MLVSGEEPTVRLGFLSEGSFFGEAAVLSLEPSVIRTRTVASVVSSELCFITKKDMKLLQVGGLRHHVHNNSPHRLLRLLM